MQRQQLQYLPAVAVAGLAKDDAQIPCTCEMLMDDYRSSFALRQPAPADTKAPTQGSVSNEMRRRETLFQVQRLMLSARPYDSIEFFHVQRELLAYLGLEGKVGVGAKDFPRRKKAGLLGWLRGRGRNAGQPLPSGMEGYSSTSMP